MAGKLRALRHTEGTFLRLASSGDGLEIFSAFAASRDGEVEVKVAPDPGTVRVTRALEVTACGTIINPKASHSQEIGGVVWGIGMALQEATEIDHRYGRIMHPNLQHYHVPVNADVHEVETLFVEEDDTVVNPLGVKGMGELGMVGIPAAIANAVFQATGRRIRELPMTPDKLL
jgi:xanthine dehydrogenase YagR molybdenum-binding subunit